MSTETYTGNHTQETREILQSTNAMTGFQGRVLLQNQQNALNPDYQVTQEDFTPVTTFENRNYRVFNVTSTVDRQAEWNRRAENQDFQTQYTTWSTEMVAKFNSHATQTGNLTEFFTHIGINTADTNNHFRHSHMKILYEKYFLNPDQENGGVKEFVKDMMDTYNTTTTSRLEERLTEIQWLADIFGADSSAMVANLIAAETKQKLRPDAFRTDIMRTTDVDGTPTMRINHLLPRERVILDHIRENNRLATIEPQRRIDKNKHTDTLPILGYTEEIKRQIVAANQKKNGSVIILGGTGSGKTTETPKMIRDLMGDDQKLIITEPRLINTASLATTIAKQLNKTWVVGEEIGYHNGDKKLYDRGGKKTDTIFMTERILMLQLLNNSHELDNLSYVMLDEVHVQGTDTELLLALLKKEQERRFDAGLSPLNIIAVSATADKVKLQKYFANDSAIEVEAALRMHEIVEKFNDEIIPIDDIPDKAAEKAISLIHDQQSSGDIVITVSGQKDMKRIKEKLLNENLGNSVEFYSIYKDSPDNPEVDKEPTPGIRRIFIATNFIETGITIKGLTYVINCGKKFENSIEESSGLSGVTEVKQSQAECRQWAGRVGRTAKGYVFHMFTEDNIDDKNSFKSRDPYPKAEMEREDLTEVVLLMKKYGRNIRDYDFLSTTTDDLRTKFEKKVSYSEDVLMQLGALDKDKEITEIGKKMMTIMTDERVDFHAARMLVEAENTGRGLLEIHTIMDLMKATVFPDTRSPLAKNAINSLNVNNSDFLTYLHIMDVFENITTADERKDWASKHFLDYAVLESLRRKRKDYLHNNPNLKPAETGDIDKFVYAGYKDRELRYKTTFRNGSHIYEWVRNPNAQLVIILDDSSVVKNTKNPAPRIIAASNQKRVNKNDPTKPLMFFSNCQPVLAAA